MGNIRTLKDKLMITADIKLLTGMHIGASNDFSPIGAVDSVVVRDPLSKKPIIPGSSLKGKIRTLLARTETDGPYLKMHHQDSEIIRRLFGCTGNTSDRDNKTDPVIARLQFYDIFMKEESVKELDEKTDLYLTEIKFENTINRLDSVANPRQIERVPSGAYFKLRLIYNLESLDEVKEDFKAIAKAFKLLQLDYIGGNGTRGYGRVSFSNFNIDQKRITGDYKLDVENLKQTLEEAENFALLSI